MKLDMSPKLLSLVVVTFILFAVFPAIGQSDEDAPPYEELWIATITTRANVRQHANTSSLILTVLDVGETITIIEQLPTGEFVGNNSLWYKIELDNDQQGYVWSGVADDLQAIYICAELPDATGWTRAIQTTLDAWNNDQPMRYVAQIYAVREIPEHLMWRLVGIYDGSPITDPIAVYDKQGDLLFTAYLSLRLYYLDVCNQLQSVLVPEYIQLPNGMFTALHQQYLPAPVADADYSTQSPPTEATLTQTITRLSNTFGMVRGSALSVMFDYEAYYRLYRISEERQWITPHLQAYYEAYAEELERFKATGDPSIQIIFAAAVSFPQSNPFPQVDLPN